MEARDVLRDGNLALRDGGEDIRLSGAVVTKQAIAAALRQFQVAVSNKLPPTHRDRKRVDLHVARSGR